MVVLFYSLLIGIFLASCQHNAKLQVNGSSGNVHKVKKDEDIYIENLHETVEKVKEVTVHVKTYRKAYRYLSNYVVNEGVGIIYSEDGHIVTNYHLVDEGTEKTMNIRILHNNIDYKAEIVNVDLKTGLAVLKIKAKKKLPILELDDSNTLRIGEEALAINDRISTFNVIKIIEENNRLCYPDSIITSTFHTLSNNGGVLVNLSGKLAGIYSSIYANQVANTTGYGVVIPISLVKRVVNDLIKDADLQFNLLGITSLPINPDSSSDLAFRIHNVSKRSPYANLLQQKDIITKINNYKFNEGAKLYENIMVRKSGERIQLTLYRKGETKMIDIVLKNFKKEDCRNTCRFL
ncbi:MAG: S1C family serine protease [Candidatus Cardinium sp.]|nr:S1C family serine protease [Candidatus Cardinium sp.]